MIPRDLASLYDAAAPGWHRTVRRLDYPRAYAQLLARLHAGAGLGSLGPGARVLECGIGTGVLSLALAGVVPFGGLVGVDIAPAMLREARRNLAAAGIPAHLHRGDATRLAQPDASFDAVISAHMLEHLARPQEAIGEMARVLRSGAPLIIVATRGNLADQLVRLKWRHVPIGREQLIAWMRRAGVEDIAVHRIGNAFSSVRALSRVFVGRRRP